MISQYSDICKAFQIGGCYIDTINKKVCYDAVLADIVGNGNLELSYAEFVDKLRPDDVSVVREVLEALPVLLRDQISFRARVADVDYVVRVIFNKNSNPTQDGVVEAFVMFDNNIDLNKFKQVEQELFEISSQLGILKQHCDIVSNHATTSQVYIDKNYIVQWGNTSLSPFFKDYPYIPGEKCYKTAHGRDIPCVHCPMKQMLETGSVVSSSIMIHDRVIEVTAHPALDVSGELLGGIMRLEDVTHGLIRERQIRDLHRLMDGILKNSPACLFVKDPNDDFRYLYWNEAMANHTKVPTESAIGKTDIEIFPNAADVDHFHRDDLNLISENRTVNFQEEFEAADGKKRTVHTIKTLIPTDDDKIPLILGVSWDITDLKNIQNELTKAKEQAEHNDRSKSQFVANMGHEIRTPINAIVGFSELLTEESLDVEDKKEYLNIIKMNNELLQQLISDILDLSKIEAHMLEFNYEHVNLNLLCSYLVTTYEMHSDLKVPIVFNEETPQYYVYSDEKRIQQIITNFMNNAIKFTHEGEIEIGLVLLNESTIEISVRDTGPGISKEKLPNIFDRFVKLNSRVNGTGLGLAICKNLVEQLGGNIGIDSEEGQGSRFWFTLPYGNLE